MIPLEFILSEISNFYQRTDNFLNFTKSESDVKIKNVRNKKVTIKLVATFLHG